MRNLRQKEVKWHNKGDTVRTEIERRKMMVFCESRGCDRMNFFLFFYYWRKSRGNLLNVNFENILPFSLEWEGQCLSWVAGWANWVQGREDAYLPRRPTPYILCKIRVFPTWPFYLHELWDVPSPSLTLCSQAVIVEWLNGRCLNCMFFFFLTLFNIILFYYV